ncbi:MAG: FkbM family methyltransferase [Parvularcula sp.]|jgi:FkbM family methyltransferase|nr:FkbM family methyltransferase [Parvularcula sp.]
MNFSFMSFLRTHGTARTAQKAWNRVEMRIRKGVLRAKGGDPVTSHYGVLMAANWGDATFESCVLGVYGNFLSDRLKREGQPFVFVDIGSNQGLYSLIAAKQPRCTRAIALEPVGSTFALLKQNVELNRLDKKIVPLQFGISVKNGTFPIYLKADHSGVASLSQREDDFEVEHARIKTADAIKQYLPSELPIAIKIDVEGHEIEVAQSLVEAAYTDRISWIFCEVDERWIDPVKLIGIMEEIGMKRFQKVGSGIHYDLMACR